MTSSRHTTCKNIKEEQNPATASPRRKKSTRSLADDLEAQPDVNHAPPGDEHVITPGTYLIGRFPALAEKYGAPLVEAYSGPDADNLRLIVKGMEDGFFAASLGIEGSPEAPAVFDHSTSKFFRYDRGWYSETTAEVLADKVRSLLLEAERACTDKH